MWIKTTFGDIINTDRLAAVQIAQNAVSWSVSPVGIGLPFADGSKEEMTAVLDRIARALAAGLPFLDLGTPEEGAVLVGYILRRAGANRLRVEREGSGGWEAMTYLPGAAHPNQYGSGPTSDAAIANLKPTKTQ